MPETTGTVLRNTVAKHVSDSSGLGPHVRAVQYAGSVFVVLDETVTVGQ
jgi:hypothetical protein